LYSTVCKDTSYNNIGTPGSGGKLATPKTKAKAGTPAPSETPAAAGMKVTAEMPTTPGTPAKAGNPAIVRHQKLKGRQRQQKCNKHQAIALMQAKR
jgi:hypothetical protein